MMRLYSVNEFEQEVFNSANSIDFAAKCITPWHLIGVKSFIAKLLEEKGSVKGFIYVKYHGVSGHVIKPDTLNFPPNADITVFWGKKAEKKSAKQKCALISQAAAIGRYSPSKQGNVYLLNAFYPDYPFCGRFIENTDMSCTPVCIDEGVGTYKTRKDLFGEKWRRDKKGAVISEIHKSIELKIGRRIPQKTLYFTIFTTGKSGTLTENTAVTRYYKQVLKDSAEAMTITDKPYVLLLTQPFELKEELAAMNEVNRAFDMAMSRYKERGLEVFVKPHPREKAEAIEEYRKKGYTVIDKSAPIEQMLNGLTKKPECVVGALSTALVTASVLCDVPAVSVIKIVSANVTGAYCEHSVKFEQRYGKVVSFFEISALGQ